jgi:hypothetical protein
VVFQIDGVDPSHLKVDLVATGGQPPPLEGPLRPHPGYAGP